MSTNQNMPSEAQHCNGSTFKFHLKGPILFPQHQVSYRHRSKKQVLPERAPSIGINHRKQVNITGSSITVGKWKTGWQSDQN